MISERIDQAGWDPTDVIEFQTAVLVRNLELIRRRSDFYLEVDRAGYLLLRALDVLGSADVVTLATELGLDASTAARQVAAMRQAGFVSRTVAPYDRRRAVVETTAEGRAAMETVRRRRRAGTAQMLTDWSDDDRHAIAGMFARYNQAITDRYLAP
ncbi:MarR family winged helix-turn-helix transcriptional regulator [Streptomyces sp. NPDC102441]|uniref:MarR family winged helix-turn-helix transcriptional regulator n=1 Tax=Streptomyces sp. NPDC102441 TaxID=3366176 RepID=UPI003801B9D8